MKTLALRVLVRGTVKQVVLLLIRGYKLCISPILPASCRFYPSCSDYTFQAVNRYGAGRGIWLGLKRLLRCHPFNPGGIDELD